MMKFKIRRATIDDLGAIVALTTNGDISAPSQCIDPVMRERYLGAFGAICADANNELYVAEMGGEVVGTMQLTFIPGISYQGGERLHIESLAVSAGYRNHGIGTQLMEDAIFKARQRGCCVVQLMTPKWREQTQRFYQKLGFSLTHEGAKLEF